MPGPGMDPRARRPYPELRLLTFLSPVSALLCFEASRLGLGVARAAAVGSFDDVDAERGLGGRLVTRAAPFGGSGKDPILVVLRTVLGMPVPIGGDGEGAGGCSFALSVGTAGVELALRGWRGVGRPERVTDREGMDVFLAEGGGMFEAVEVRRDSAELEAMLSPDNLRVLATGKAGSGPVGGGRGVRGS